MSRLIKPAQWSRPSLANTSPEWSWFWNNIVVAYPFWANNKFAQDVGPFAASRKLDSPSITVTNSPFGPGVAMPLNGTTQGPQAIGASFAQPFTICTLMRLDAVIGSVNRAVFSVENNAVDVRLMHIGFNQDEVVSAEIRRGTTSIEVVDTTAVSVGDIVFGCFVSRTTTDHELYVNGVSVATSSGDSQAVSEWDQTRFFDRGSEPPASCFMAAALDFVPSVEQIKQLNADPFGPFRPRDTSPHVFVIPAVGPTQQAATISATASVGARAFAIRQQAGSISATVSVGARATNIHLSRSAIKATATLTAVGEGATRRSAGISAAAAVGARSTNTHFNKSNITPQLSVGARSTLTKFQKAGISISSSIGATLEQPTRGQASILSSASISASLIRRDLAAPWHFGNRVAQNYHIGQRRLPR